MAEVMIGLVAGIVVGGVGSAVVGRRRKRRYAEAVGGYDNLVRLADHDRLREIKYERGELHAIRALRSDFPAVPLADARRLVATL